MKKIFALILLLSAPLAGQICTNLTTLRIDKGAYTDPAAYLTMAEVDANFGNVVDLCADIDSGAAWNAPVANVAALPTCATVELNTLRYAITEGAIYYCPAGGAPWVSVGGSGAVGSTGDFQLTDGSGGHVASLLNDDGTDVTMASGQVKLPAGTPALPELAVGGVASVGLTGTAVGQLSLVSEGLCRWTINGSQYDFASCGSGGAGLNYDSVTLTLPGLVPRKGDLDTGVGADGVNNHGSLIGGGVSILEFHNDATSNLVTVSGQATQADPPFTVDWNGDGQVNFVIDANGYIRNYDAGGNRLGLQNVAENTYGYNSDILSWQLSANTTYARLTSNAGSFGTRTVDATPGTAAPVNGVTSGIITENDPGTVVGYSIGQIFGLTETSFAPVSGATNYTNAWSEFTMNQTGTASGNYTLLGGNVTETAVLGAGPHYLLDLQVDASSVFTVESDGDTTLASGQFLAPDGAWDTAPAYGFTSGTGGMSLLGGDLALSRSGSTHGLLLTATTVEPTAGGSWSIQQETVSLTNPMFIPSKLDNDTGLGGDGSDTISVVAGGLNVLEVDNDGTSNTVIVSGQATQAGNVLAVDATGDAVVDFAINETGQIRQYNTAAQLDGIHTGDNGAFSLYRDNAVFASITTDGTSINLFSTAADDYFAIVNNTLSFTNVAAPIIGLSHRGAAGLTGTQYGIGLGKAFNKTSEWDPASGTGDYVNVWSSFTANQTGSASGNYTLLGGNVTETAVLGAGPHYLLDLQVDASSVFSVESGGNTTLATGDLTITSPGILRFDDTTDAGIKSLSGVGYLLHGADLAYWRWNNAAFGDVVTSGPRMLRETASLTNPTFTPYASDVDTGVGSDGSGTLALVADGLNVLAVDNDATSNAVSVFGQATQAADAFVVKADGTVTDLAVKSDGTLELYQEGQTTNGALYVNTTGNDATVYVESQTDNAVITLDAPTDEVVAFNFRHNGLDEWQLSGGASSTVLTLYELVGTDEPVMTFEDTGDVTVSKGKFRLPDGTAADPSLAWISDDDGSGTGIYRSGVDDVGISIDGTLQFSFAGNRLQGGLTTGPKLVNEAASATNPTLVPYGLQESYGIGLAFSPGRTIMIAQTNPIISAGVDLIGPAAQEPLYCGVDGTSNLCKISGTGTQAANVFEIDVDGDGDLTDGGLAIASDGDFTWDMNGNSANTFDASADMVMRFEGGSKVTLQGFHAATQKFAFRNHSGDGVIGVTVETTAGTEFITFGDKGALAVAPVQAEIHSTRASGLNVPGGGMLFNSGDSTGSGLPGNFIWEASPSSGSSSTLNTPVTAMTLDGETGQLLIDGGTAALPGYGFSSRAGHGLRQSGTALYLYTEGVAAITMDSTQHVYAANGASWHLDPSSASGTNPTLAPRRGTSLNSGIGSRTTDTVNIISDGLTVAEALNDATSSYFDIVGQSTQAADVFTVDATDDATDDFVIEADGDTFVKSKLLIGTTQFNIASAALPQGYSFNWNGGAVRLFGATGSPDYLQMFLDSSWALRFSSGSEADSSPNATPADGFISGHSALGTDIAGADINLTAGKGTGTGAGGSVISRIAPAGSTGASLNPLVATWTANQAEHMVAGVTDPVLSACGTSPTVAGSDTAMKVTIGTGSTTSCTVTFAAAYAAAPACVITGDNTALGYAATTSTTVLTITSSADMASDVISAICIGVT